VEGLIMSERMENNQELTEILFRERIDNGRKELELSDIAFTIDYLIWKLSDAPPDFGHEEFLAQGGKLIDRVQSAYANDNYSNRLKADLVQYLSDALTTLLRVKELDAKSKNPNETAKPGPSHKKYMEQLLPKNRGAFSYGAQVVDALVELTIRTGAIQRDSAKSWKSLKQAYEVTHQNDDLIRNAYNSLVFMKVMMLHSYKKLNLLVSTSEVKQHQPVK
jgi:hypothetical protein